MATESDKQRSMTLAEAVALGVQMHQAGRLAAAESVYRQILESAPDHPDALHFLGMVCGQSGRSQEAIDLLTRVVALVPTYAPALNNLGNVLKEQGRLEEAVTAYRKVLALEPLHVAAWNNLGVVLKEQGDWAGAVAAYHRAIALQPDYADAHYNLANALVKHGKPAEAEAAFRKSLDLRPDHAEAYYQLGNLYHDQGRTDEALAAFRQTTRLESKHAAAHYEMGNTLRKQGLAEDAILAYRKAISLDPHLDSAYKNLATVLSLLARTDEAVAVWQQWLVHDPNNPIARHMLAAATGRDVPARAADEFVVKLFDGFADSFDERLKHLDYRSPDVVLAALGRAIGSPRADLAVLDAGCGTGWCGPMLRPYARSLAGVDLSPGMVERARRRAIYDQLLTAELTEFLSRGRGIWDLIASADTFAYFGDLAPVLTAAAGALRASGHLAFTVERMTGQEAAAGYLLHERGRYSHTEEYVRNCLTQAGLVVVELSQSDLRMESSRPVSGLVVLARK